MPHHTTWVLVANSAEAKIFQLTKFPHMEIVECFSHPESHLHNQDLISSPPGRNFQSNSTARSAYEPKTSAKENECDRFAKTLSSHLTHALDQNKFERLYIIAETTFLGLLRHHLDARVKQTIISESTKDLTKHKVCDIEKTLMEVHV